MFSGRFGAGAVSSGCQAADLVEQFFSWGVLVKQSWDFPTRKIALPGPPHEKDCSTWSSPREGLLYQDFPTRKNFSTRSSPREGLLYQVLPTRRSALPDPPHEKDCSTTPPPKESLPTRAQKIESQHNNCSLQKPPFLRPKIF